MHHEQEDFRGQLALDLDQQLIGPCDWQQFRCEMGDLLGEDPQEFFHFCQDIHHLGVWEHVLSIFRKAGIQGKHFEVLKKLKIFYTANELWKELRQLPERLRENLPQMLTAAAFDTI